ncbi:YybH family protein [Gracilimonas sp.]|uniref:YybH family protein n=1 Tax=Gracilimonas sp. TaxID=1974203 RepID=UPI003BAA30D3
MKYLLLFTSCTILTLTLTSCSTDSQKSDQEIRAEFEEVFHTFYEVYGSSDPDFVDYYAEDFINMDNTGNVERGAANYKKVWEANFSTHVIDSLSYTDPEIIFSRDMIFTYNDYWERFKNRETGESRDVSGTWMAVWKPIDGEWKVVMTTYHSP